MRCDGGPGQRCSIADRGLTETPSSQSQRPHRFLQLHVPAGPHDCLSQGEVAPVRSSAGWPATTTARPRRLPHAVGFRWPVAPARASLRPPDSSPPVVSPSKASACCRGIRLVLRTARVSSSRRGKRPAGRFPELHGRSPGGTGVSDPTDRGWGYHRRRYRNRRKAGAMKQPVNIDEDPMNAD